MQFKFMKYRRLSYAIVSAMVALSVLSLAFRGLNYGIDFAGGISMEIAPKNADYTIDRMRQDLAAFSPELQEMKDTGRIIVRVGLSKDATEAQQQEAVREIKEALGDRVGYENMQVVGPKIGGELIRGGIMATIFAFVLMAVYIWIRYRSGYAIGAFVTLILDFIIMFGFFSAAGLEFNQTAIAIILMVIGYSTNDKIVNYDRIQENTKKYHKMPMTDLVDLSINEMLGRTIITSVTTALAMVGLYLFGGAVLRDFSIAMLFGIILGTATSMFISNALILNFNVREDK
ncbi:MAG: protein translocase subunit SecF [Alphaproteobacteria bacterium]|nr:protein translocase subunit SecF [Alphaproteobacteria bacterium]